MHPEQNTIVDKKGNSYTYDQLVIAAGISADYSFAKGAEEALKDKDCPVTSIYDLTYAAKTNRLAQSFAGGKAIFTESQGPVKCGGAP